MTVSDALAVPALRSAGPVVLAGVADLGRQVRWVHTTELVDTAPLLRGGDLVLSTGIALPDGPDDLAAFTGSLDRSEAAGLVIELGRRWTEVPAALVAACERLSLPLVAPWPSTGCATGSVTAWSGARTTSCSSGCSPTAARRTCWSAASSPGSP